MGVNLYATPRATLEKAGGEEAPHLTHCVRMIVYLLDARRCARVLFTIAGGLVLLGVLLMASWHLGGPRNRYVLSVTKLFDLSADTSIPTWFSAAILFVAALLLAVIGHVKRTRRERFAGHWLGLALGFGLMSVDEVAAVHEQLGRLFVEPTLGPTSGMFHYAWTIVGLVIVAVVLVLYLSFLRHLPPRARWLMVASGGLFVGGALGVEMMNGWYSEGHGAWNLVYALGTAVEEGMEMSGVCLFVYTLMRYLEQYVGVVHLRVGVGAAAAEAPRREA